MKSKKYQALEQVASHYANDLIEDIENYSFKKKEFKHQKNNTAVEFSSPQGYSLE